MNDLLIVILCSLAGGVVSLIGGLLLIARKRKMENVLKYVTPFAAGALLAAAFTDILPEAGHQGNIDQALRWTLIGILVFFLLERFLHWFHHHHSRDQAEHKDATVPLIIIGDTIHNVIDGVAIAAAFLIDIPTGIVVTVAIAAHEIPQEIGDFGLLLSKGVSKRNVLLVNIVSALATTVAAVAFYLLGGQLNIPFGILMGLVAGFFIYIAVSDIIPHIHQNEKQKLAGVQTFMLIVGVILVSATTMALHSIIEQSEAEAVHSIETHL